MADGTTTSTLSNNSLISGQTSGSNLGKFYVDSSGNVSASGTIKLQNGSASDPSYTFSNDSNTGIYNDGSDGLYFTTGGSLKFDIGTAAVETALTFWPTVNNTYDLGSNALRFRNAYLGSQLNVPATFSSAMVLSLPPLLLTISPSPLLLQIW